MVLSISILGMAAFVTTSLVLLTNDKFRSVLKGKILSAIYNARISCGVARSWLWFIANDVDDPNHFYCPHIGERMICQYCPHHVKNETEKYIEWYCELAYKKLRWERN